MHLLSVANIITGDILEFLCNEEHSLIDELACKLSRSFTFVHSLSLLGGYRSRDKLKSYPSISISKLG